MGQRANSNRQAPLDEKKSRAAGRRNERGRAAIRDGMGDEQFAKGKTGGATGRTERTNARGASGVTRGGGGGGGASSRPRAAAEAAKTPVGRSSRPARKRAS